ncbi:murein DD-endopeptidase MepM/ murein hydrolase activator NlpD [Arthrobacter sp. V4I6]|uniref:M23 family metallopeptidase n=1 Tax=Arthrobacter sp. V4I6 TaxID=3042281 RepID=UPI0027856493|nr:M23 family metallopeptidase [Arthrobacter sp. V4I6]MDQ0854769.1 murein DD-endopeptidase MepM/ murein hydrolase activator NlpD [Arthrobacter sp. V4I6]
MRPTSHRTTQGFASMPTAGVRGNLNAPHTTPEYYVGLYGNYQPYGHAGEDHGAPVGTPIHAMRSGTVLYAGWGYNLPGTGPIRKWLFYAGMPGKLTVIQHPGWIGAYAHQSEIRVTAGQDVTEGEVIGLTGDTGGVAPHLHVEALVDLGYRTGGGLIYGRADPAKYYGSTTPGLGAQGDTTPQEDEMTPEQLHELKLFIQADNEARHRVTRSVVGKLLDASELDLKLFSQEDSENRHRVTRESILEELRAAAAAAAAGQAK